MASLPKPFYTPEQYLEMERLADYKSEYLSGEIFAMAGGTEAHNLVVTNIVRELSTRLKGRPCRTYPSDMKIECGAAGLYAYPDVSVVCGEPRFHGKRTDMVLNPMLIVEVLSPSTEAYDRGAKFAQYGRVESLTDYLLVSTTAYRVEHFARRADHQWLLTEYTQPDDVVEIASLGCELPMAEIYDQVTLEPPPLRTAF